MIFSSRLVIVFAFLLLLIVVIFYLLKPDAIQNTSDQDLNDLPNQRYEKFELRGTAGNPPPGISGTSYDYPQYVSFEYPSEFNQDSKRSLCHKTNNICIQVQVAIFNSLNIESIEELYISEYSTKITPKPVTVNGRQAFRTAAVVTLPAFENLPSQSRFITELYVPTKKRTLAFSVISEDNPNYAIAVLGHVIETLVSEDAS